MFSNVDFEGATGLDRCVHQGPSGIDTRTLLNPNNDLPPTFLSGCGVPQMLIDYLPQLRSARPWSGVDASASPLRFDSCFISHAAADTLLANQLRGALRMNGIQCFIAPQDMVPGEENIRQIERLIDLAEKVSVIISTPSMNSQWVRTEIGLAREKEVSTERSVLVPLRLVPIDQMRKWKLFDSDSGEDLAKYLRSLHSEDFTNWRDPALFAASVERIAVDLQRKSDANQR